MRRGPATRRSGRVRGARDRRLLLLSCLGVEMELTFLPHFARHYLTLGVAPEDVHVILNATDPGTPALREAEDMAASLGLAPPRRWIAPYTSETMWAQRRALQGDVARPGDWILNADIDEHHVYPAPPVEIVRHCRAWGVTAVQGTMIDRLAPGGTLALLRPEPDLGAQFPIRADLSISLFGRRRGEGLGGTVKLMLHRADVFPSRGGHRARDEDAPRYLLGAPLAERAEAEDPAARLHHPFRVDHYKWTAARLAKQRRRMATPGASASGLHHGGRLADYIERHGRIRLEDATVAGSPAADPPDWRRAALLARLGHAARRMARRFGR